jgi:hypothetical protein
VERDAIGVQIITDAFKAFSAPLPRFPLTDWRLAVGPGLVPLIPLFRSVRDYSQHAQCSAVPM